MEKINILFICLDTDQHTKNEDRAKVSWISSVSPTIFESIAKDLICNFSYNGQLYTKITKLLLDFKATKYEEKMYDAICYVKQATKGDIL